MKAKLTDVDEYRGEVIVETDNAILFKERSTGKEKWFPKSQVKYLREFDPLLGKTETTVYIPEWLAKDKEII